MVWPLRLFRINMIVSPGWYVDALALKVTGPVLGELGGAVGVAFGVGMGLVVLTGEGMAVDGVVETVGLLVSYGPQLASNVRTVKKLREISRRPIRFILDLLVTIKIFRVSAQVNNYAYEVVYPSQIETCIACHRFLLC